MQARSSRDRQRTSQEATTTTSTSNETYILRTQAKAVAESLRTDTHSAAFTEDPAKVRKN